MNESKSARYHRLKRRAGFVSLTCTAALLVALLWARASQGILPLFVLLELVALPFVFYRSFILERRYELSSESLSAWLRDHVKALGLTLAVAVTGAHLLYVLIRWSAAWWWLPAAGLAASALTLLAKAAPVALLPLFYKFAPVERLSLVERLMALSRKAGVPVLGVYAWGLGAKTRRANAALVGFGSTRRILVSDTLLAEYSDDEIEVILAHEMAHHVHHDIAKGILVETVLLVCGCYASAVALRTYWEPLGLSAPSDVAGLPLLLLAGGAVMLAATPLTNAFSRFNERQADRFALQLTGLRTAFASAMRRLASQNLAEESPSRASAALSHAPAYRRTNRWGDIS